MSFATSLSTRYAGPPAVPGYVLDDYLGRGASAVVWAATCVASGDRVAVKVLAPDPAADGVAPRWGAGVAAGLAGAERERELTRRVGTAHVVRLHDVVPLEDGRVGLVLDLADGGSLRDVVSIRAALPLGEVVTALTPLASALAQLHEHGVVHADVAPGNVLFTPDGRPMLADLSSARLVDDPWSGVVVGTDGFTAPEVVAGAPPTPESDVWSLAALAWYARTGGTPPPPWVGDLHWPGAAHPSTDPPGGDHPGNVSERGNLDAVAAAVGPQLRPILVRMLADDPQARPGAAEVALALYRAAAPEPVGLVGHHPDPAAAVTIRIRREAAETRSRAQLREAARDEARRAAGGRLVRRAQRLLRPWDRPPPTADGSGSAPVATAVGREATAEPLSTSEPARRPVLGPPVGRRTTAGGSLGPLGPLGTVRMRVVIAALASLALAGGLVSLLRLTGSPSRLAGTSVSGAVPGGSEASAGAAAGGVSAGPDTSTVVDPARDPVAALQRIADLRAQALEAADLVALRRAEQAGSGAYEADSRTIARLREQRQRYADLAFSVRSAQVERATADAVVLRAVVDRAAATVLGEDGSAQPLAAAPGAALTYTLTRAESGWQLTEVGAA